MNFNFKGIDHIQLAAPKGCEAEAIQFFQEILGFRVIEKPENLSKRGGAWFQIGHQQIHVGVEEPFTPAKKAHPAFEVENIEQLKLHLLGYQIDIIEDSNLPGATRFYLKDPFGNRIEFLEWNTK